MVALEIGVGVKTLHHVLHGHSRSPRILMALYERAQENKRQGYQNPYSREFVECAVSELM